VSAEAHLAVCDTYRRTLPEESAPLDRHRTARLPVMTTEEGSKDLERLCIEAADALQGFPDLLRHGEVIQFQHEEHAARAAQVGAWLCAVHTLAASGAAPQSFALARTVMERWAIDSVILLGDRYVELYPNTTQPDFEAAVRRWAKGELPSVLERPELDPKGRMRIVRRGLTMGEDDGRVLHPLYFETDQYDPFFGAPNDQPDLVDGSLFGDPQRTATRVRDRYRAWFQWSAVLESLELNKLIEPAHRVQLRTHYRFLSAFAHGYDAAHRTLTPTRFGSTYSAQHISKELAFLYSAQFSARYLDALLRMADREPRVEVDERQWLETLATDLLDRSRHLWFLEAEPTLYDRGQELLDQAVKSRTWGARHDPMSLAVEEIRYYRNPLERLARLHESSTEIVTGFTYLSPWLTAPPGG